MSAQVYKYTVLGVSRLEATTAKLNLIQPIPVKLQRLLQKLNYCERDKNKLQMLSA